jgi:hypothetical protein
MHWSLPLVVVCSLAFSAQATLISNGSFEKPESPDTPSLSAGSPYIDDWLVANSDIALVRTADFPFLRAQHGNYSLDLTGYDDVAPLGGVQQAITTVLGYTYSLSFYVAARNGTATVGVSAGDLNDTASVTAGDEQVWQYVQRRFTATGSTTVLTFVGLAASSNGTYIGLDSVWVEDTAVPEPATLALTASALSGVWLFRRRLC